MIEARKIVSLHYTLKNDAGEVLDTSEGGEALVYLHGAHQIVPGLERALEGLAVGDERNVVVAAEEGYGQHDPDGIFGIPRAAFPADVKLTIGDTFMGENHDGTPIPVRVVEVADDEVRVDANHPLAGATLHFHVVVQAVRDATLDEMMRGQAAGSEHKH